MRLRPTELLGGFQTTDIGRRRLRASEPVEMRELDLRDRELRTTFRPVSGATADGGRRWRNEGFSRVNVASTLHAEPARERPCRLTHDRAFCYRMERTGIEPVTPCLQSRCSPN